MNQSECPRCQKLRVAESRFCPRCGHEFVPGCPPASEQYGSPPPLAAPSARPDGAQRIIAGGNVVIRQQSPAPPAEATRGKSPEYCEGTDGLISKAADKIVAGGNVEVHQHVIVAPRKIACDVCGVLREEDRLFRCQRCGRTMCLAHKDIPTNTQCHDCVRLAMANTPGGENMSPRLSGAALDEQSPSLEADRQEAGTQPAAEWKRDREGSIVLLSLLGRTLVDRHLDDLRSLTAGRLTRLVDLSTLQTLYLCGTGIGDDAMSQVAALRNLRDLRLDHTSITDRAMTFLEGLNQLETLAVAGTNISDAGLKHLLPLSRLKTLKLADTRLTDAAVEHLGRLQSLRRLDLRGTGVSKEGRKRLRQALPDVEIE